MIAIKTNKEEMLFMRYNNWSLGKIQRLRQVQKKLF